jgi:mannose-6-phosphate isomerase-like protein (cupin superfamily)
MLPFYRWTTLGLLVTTTALGLAVLTMPDPQPIDPAAVATALASIQAPGPGSPPAAPGAGGLVVIDLPRKVEQISWLFSDAHHFEEWIEQSPPGAVGVRVLGFGHRDPWHYFRRRTVHTWVLQGEGFLRWECEGGGGMAVRAGDLVTVAPWCTHRWENSTSLQMLSTIQWHMPWLLHDHASDAIQVDPGHEAGQVGPAPRRIRPLAELTPGEAVPPRLQWEEADATVELRADRGPAVVLVVAGTARAADDTWAVQPGTLLRIPAGTAVALTGAEGLRMLRVDPHDDGVPAAVRERRSVWSQGPEEAIVQAVLGDLREGFFLDVGAADARELSTTYLLESTLGWRGIAVDAQAEYAAGWAEHRPGSRFFVNFVSDRSDSEATLWRDARLPVSASTSAAVAEEQSMAAFGNAELEAVAVSTIALDDLLVREGVERIDFFSLDIEEHEPEALRGFDLARWQPRLIAVEAHGRVQEALHLWFVRHAYRRLDTYLPHDPVNWYYVPAELPGP